MFCSAISRNVVLRFVSLCASQYAWLKTHARAYEKRTSDANSTAAESQQKSSRSIPRLRYGYEAEILVIALFSARSKIVARSAASRGVAGSAYQSMLAISASRTVVRASVRTSGDAAGDDTGGTF